MFKIEVNGNKLSVIYKSDFYEAVKNGEVIFKHMNYELVREVLFSK